MKVYVTSDERTVTRAHKSREYGNEAEIELTDVEWREYQAVVSAHNDWQDRLAEKANEAFKNTQS